MKILGLTIITTTEYKKIIKMKSMMHEKIMELLEENAELKKQLLYQKTYNTVFRQKLDEVIYPNTDERGLGDSRPVNSEEEPDYSDF